MSIQSPIRFPDKLYIDGAWRQPSSTEKLSVIDSNSEDLYFSVASANVADMNFAVDSARRAFDEGPWPRLAHSERADYLRALASALRKRRPELADIWPRESGVLATIALSSAEAGAQILTDYADLSESFPWEERRQPTNGGALALLIREPVGVVGAIVPWNLPLKLALHKVAPALVAGCCVILKASPEAPGAAYILAECADEIGLPPGVLNVLTADREVSEQLVADHRVDKIAFTGSTGAGRRIASLMGERIGRYTLELGGKSAAVILDDADIPNVARQLARAGCALTGQVCASLTRLIVPRERHDEFVEAVAAELSQIKVGNAFDPDTAMGPVASAAQRERIEAFVSHARYDGTQIAFGGGRPKDIDRGYFVNPVLFGNVDNSARIAREEIFGPVLCVIPVASEKEAIQVANDSIYGLNSSVFTADVDRARRVGRALKAGTVGHNAYRSDFGIAFGGYKQSGIGREGGAEGLRSYLETKLFILDEMPAD